MSSKLSRMGSFALIRHSVRKENSDFKPALLRFKNYAYNEAFKIMYKLTLTYLPRKYNVNSTMFSQLSFQNQIYIPILTNTY